MFNLLLFLALIQNPTPSRPSVRTDPATHSTIPGPVQRSPWHHRLIGKGCYITVQGKRVYEPCSKFKGLPHA